MNGFHTFWFVTLPYTAASLVLRTGNIGTISEAYKVTKITLDRFL
jgi:hypothetical protein